MTDLDSLEGTDSLLKQFQALGGGVILGNGSVSIAKGYCLAERTDTDCWTLTRSKADPRGGFYVTNATLEEALRLIRDGTVARETEVLSSREQAKRILSSAIVDAYGPDSVKSEQLLEAVDLLAS